MRHLTSGLCLQKRCMMTAETTTASGAIGVGRGGRMSRQRKRDAVLRLLRGEDLETVSRSLGVTAATLTAWRDSFLAGGEAALAARPTDGETPALSLGLHPGPISVLLEQLRLGLSLRPPLSFPADLGLQVIHLRLGGLRLGRGGRDHRGALLPEPGLVVLGSLQLGRDFARSCLSGVRPRLRRRALLPELGSCLGKAP